MEEKIEHIAIIPDGNRRWAKKHKKSLLEAYEKGIRKLGDVAKWAHEANVKTLTLWGFSTENFKRSKEEKEILWHLFEKFLKEGINKYYKEQRKGFKEVKINFLGRLHFFPESIQKLMKDVMRLTKNNKPYTVNFLMAYGGRAEIVDAVNKIVEKRIKNVDEAIFSSFLYTKGQKDPDLIIRTGGEKRLSGLLPWQSVYSELYFCEKLWPEFTKKDFKDAIEDYKRRKRKFGE